MFPQFYDFGFFKIRKDWKNLGRRKGSSRVENDSTINIRSVCTLCNSRINVGMENNKTFLYCPLCLIKNKKIINN